jgi:hypothetical protein
MLRSFLVLLTIAATACSSKLRSDEAEPATTVTATLSSTATATTTGFTLTNAPASMTYVMLWHADEQVTDVQVRHAGLRHEGARRYLVRRAAVVHYSGHATTFELPARYIVSLTGNGNGPRAALLEGDVVRHQDGSSSMSAIARWTEHSGETRTEVHALTPDLIALPTYSIESDESLYPEIRYLSPVATPDPGTVLAVERRQTSETDVTQQLVMIRDGRRRELAPLAANDEVLSIRLDDGDVARVRLGNGGALQVPVPPAPSRPLPPIEGPAIPLTGAPKPEDWAASMHALREYRADGTLAAVFDLRQVEALKEHMFIPGGVYPVDDGYVAMVRSIDRDESCTEDLACDSIVKILHLRRAAPP